MNENEILKNFARALGAEDTLKEIEEKEQKQKKMLEGMAKLLGTETVLQEIDEKEANQRRLTEEKREREKKLLEGLNASLASLVGNNPEHSQIIEQEVAETIAETAIIEDLQPMPELPKDDIVTPGVEFLSKVPQKDIQQAADIIPPSLRKELDILKKSVADFHRFAQRHSQMGGGGEVWLKKLDDVNYSLMQGATDGQVLTYSESLKKWYPSNTSSNGYAGSAGAGYTGSIGSSGYTGSAGSDGSLGYTGSTGAGYTGSQGSAGFVGSSGLGYTGSAGIGYSGSAGSIGFTGSVGTTGYTGSKGDLGFTGSVGFTGSAGTNGSNGYNGSVGYTGSLGITGYSGSFGSTGYTGSIGIGYSGSQGSIGYTGSTGPAGTTGSWTVATGSNSYSFTVPASGTYMMWVRGNIPNGIITWNATATVTNTNVPVLGQQFAWNYTGGGTPLEITAIPAQFVGTPGAIVSSNPSVGSTTNQFLFTINNASGTAQTVYWGYVTQ